MFEIHPQLVKDCITVTRLELSHVLLMNDASYPWFILVPERENIREIYELDEADQQLLTRESVKLGQFLMQHFHGDKLNVAALGNLVPQLHIHHIVRFETDASWPAPVWGQHPPQPYDSNSIADIKSLFSEFE